MQPGQLPNTSGAATQPCSWLRHGRRLGTGCLTLGVLIRSTEKLGLSLKASELFDTFVERAKHFEKYSVLGCDFFFFSSKAKAELLRDSGDSLAG